MYILITLKHSLDILISLFVKNWEIYEIRFQFRVNKPGLVDS